jgi:hypothetical protein
VTEANVIFHKKYKMVYFNLKETTILLFKLEDREEEGKGDKKRKRGRETQGFYNKLDTH